MVRTGRADDDPGEIELRILRLEANLEDQLRSVKPRVRIALASEALGEAARAIATGRLGAAHEYLERARFLIGSGPGHSHSESE